VTDHLLVVDVLRWAEWEYRHVFFVPRVLTGGSGAEGNWMPLIVALIEAIAVSMEEARLIRWLRLVLIFELVLGVADDWQLL